MRQNYTETNRMSNTTEVPLQIKIENGKNIRIFCSTTAFENIRKITIETIASNYALEKTENRDISRKVVIEAIKTKEKNTRRASNICHQHVQYHQHTIDKWNPSTEISEEILPVLQSGVDQNKKEIDICDQHLEKMLGKVYPGRQKECNNSSQHKVDHKIKGVNDDIGENLESNSR